MSWPPCGQNRGLSGGVPNPAMWLTDAIAWRSRTRQSTPTTHLPFSYTIEIRRCRSLHDSLSEIELELSRRAPRSTLTAIYLSHFAIVTTWHNYISILRQI